MSLSTHLGSLLSSIRLTGSHIPKTKDCADPTEPDLLEMSHVQGSPDSVSASEADKPANGANRLCDFGQNYAKLTEGCRHSSGGWRNVAEGGSANRDLYEPAKRPSSQKPNRVAIDVLVSVAG